MKKITLLCAFLITSLGFSQTYDLLTNGDFENGTEPWVGNNLSVVAGEAFVSETNAGGNPWDTQLVHANLQFEENAWCLLIIDLCTGALNCNYGS